MIRMLRTTETPVQDGGCTSVDDFRCVIWLVVFAGCLFLLLAYVWLVALFAPVG
jgi:hypothetical protein